MKDSQIREHISKGWVRALITFEVVGKPKKHIEQALAEYIDNIKKDERIIMLKEEREDAIEHEDGMFSTFSECEMLAKGLETFTWLCINFSPASIEILEPEELRIEERELTNWLNDLLSMVHEIGTNYRSVKSAKDHLTVALNELIKNSIMLSLKSGPLDEKALAAGIGIEATQLAPFLKFLVEKQRIQKNGALYQLAGPRAIKLMPAPPRTMPKQVIPVPKITKKPAKSKKKQ
jgi:hypothetical protein